MQDQTKSNHKANTTLRILQKHRERQYIWNV